MRCIFNEFACKNYVLVIIFIAKSNPNTLLNQDILREIKNIDCQKVVSNIESFLSDQVKKSGAKGMIFGLSGGIDSAVLAYICGHIMKEKTLAMIMPDTKITPKTETEDALRMITLTGINYKLVDIKPIVDEYALYMEPEERAIGNLRARVRANILYYYANVKNYLVLGSSDRSELMIGYFTKFGDGAADLIPISSLYKIQVREIAKFLGVPKNVIEKKSSPHLWKEHTAEEEIGATYEKVDATLHCLFDKKLSVEDTASTIHLEKETVEKIYQACNYSNHKRRLPIGPVDIQT